MRRTLADLLLEERLVSEDQLPAAEQRARRESVPLVVALLDEGLVSEQQLVELLERRLQLGRVDPATVIVELEAIRQVPHDLAQAHRVLPLALERRGGREVLRLAMADPLDSEAVDEIESSTACLIEPVVAARSELEPAIERAYRGMVTKQIPRGPAAPGERLPQPGEATQPQRRLEDLAPPDVRLRALVQLLVDKGVLSDEEYREAVRRLVTDGGEG